MFKNRHFQTIWPNYFRIKPLLSLANRKITLPDDDFLIANSLTIPAESEEEGIVLIFHGLGGSIQSHYSLSLMSILRSNNLKPIFVHFRGSSGIPNKKTISYHAGKTDDIDFMINKIHKENPDKKLFAIGISIGGSALLNYLGRHRQNNPLDASIAISVPYQLHDAAIQLNTGISKIYQRYLLATQKKTLKTKFKQMHCPIDLKKALQAKSFYDFDNAATAPLHGFDGVDDYYQQCSSKQYLKNIQTPTLLIHAEDDPFMSEKSIPNKDELTNSVQLDLHKHGGHVGFVKNNKENSQRTKVIYYLDTKVPEYFLSFIR